MAEVSAAAAPRLRLLGTVALVAPRPLAFADERRYRLALFLALAPGAVPRDTLAALFWPERTQAAARSNLRKLLMELRALALPGLVDDGEALHWPVAHDSEAAPWAPPLQGLSGGDSPAFEHWLAERRQALQEAWCARALAQARAQLPGDAHAALSLARQVLQADALHEGAGRLVEAALLALGRGHEAAAWREQFARRLQAELGTAWPAAPAEAIGDGLLGRHEELQALRGLLEERRCRLVTLTGPGGVGKSALALALLQRPGVAADGAWWVALEDLHDAGQLLPRIARELGLALGPASDGWAEVVVRLQGRQALLLLDNAEHLPGLPALLRRLLDALPGLRCVATSRVRLALADEWLLPVPPLPAAAARQLFLRAAQAAPWRQPIAADDALLAPLVEALGRLPLALALAATWTRHLALPALLQQAQRGLELLANPHSPDEHPAHASLRATFERSWQFLAPALRPVLAALSVGVGTLPLHVAQALGPASAAQLAALADASLLTMGSDGRVGMHPLLRQFAADKLDEAGGREAARRRHLQALAALMAPWKDFDETDGAEALRAITPELANLLVAWDAALAFADAAALADMAEALGHLHQTQGGIARVLPRFEQAEALLAGLREPAALCRVALELAALRYWLGDYDGVESAARRALRAARAARLARAKRQALNVLALAAMRRGRNEEGAAWLGQALALARADGATREAAVYAGNLAAPLRELGRLEEAEALARQALQGYRDAAHAVGELAVLNELGLVAHQRGALDDAFDAYAQALQVAGRLGLPLRRPVLLTHQASVRLDQGRGAEALALAEAAGAEVERVGARSHAPTQRRLQAEALLACGRTAEAVAPLRDAWALVQPLDGSSRTRGFLYSCAGYARAAGQADVALALCTAAAHRGDTPMPLLARYRRLFDELQATAAGTLPAPPDDAALQRLVDRLLG